MEPKDPGHYLNVRDTDETPLVGTDQYEDEPTFWQAQGPHHPYLRGPLGTIVLKLRALLTGPERRWSETRSSY